MKVQANTIEELFSISGQQESDLRELDKLIVKTAPGLTRQLFSGSSITMIGYGEMTWMNKSSSRVWPLVSVAPQKGNISIYVAAEKEGVLLAQIYKKRLGKTNNGKIAYVSNGRQRCAWMDYKMLFWIQSNGAKCRNRISH